MENSPMPLQEISPSRLANIRLVATDMDGTLTQQGQFTADLLRSLTDLATANIQTLIVTGRSAGWVQGLAAYLPVIGAIAENGGVFIPKSTWQPVPLVEIANMTQHRNQLAEIFAKVQVAFPDLKPSVDNCFRLTDWTFDIGDLAAADLALIAKTCTAAGWGFTYSTVQCHIRPAAQDKGIGLRKFLQTHLPQLSSEEVVTVGDSPNDEGLFDMSWFPLSVGVANVKHYCDRLQHLPQFITRQPEIEGFQALVQSLVTARR